jgi:hypothetical protein
MDNHVGRLQSLFPKHQFDVIVGSLLGDGRLECRSRGIRHAKTARFRVHHGEKQSSYVLWKYSILENLVMTPPRSITRFDRKRDVYETSEYFHTKSTEELGIIHDWFYSQEGVKRLPFNLDQVLTPHIMAVWYMDDGNRTTSRVTLNTHSFGYYEQERVIEIFRNLFGLNCTLVKDRNQFKISIKASSVLDFLDIISPFVIKSMAYKIVYPRNDLLNV